MESYAGGDDGSPYGSLEVILFHETWGIQLAEMPSGLFKGKA